MKILHHLGHRPNWNLDCYFENKVGDGFVFGAFNFDAETYNRETITGNSYRMQEAILPLSSIDLQFYGKTSSKDLGKFYTYPFHPANHSRGDRTDIYGPNKIYEAIKFQENLGIKRIVIPNFFWERNIGELISMINSVNSKLKKRTGVEYFMTLPLSFNVLKDEADVDRVLAEVTHRDKIFDGYYVVAEPEIGFKRKLCIDYDYLENLYRVFRILKKNKLKVIYGYANWDAILFHALVDLDYVTIGTYENLRNFKIKRFTEDPSGGASKGAYFSSKALNFIKAEELTKFRRKKALKLIANNNNIFSDIILGDDFLWTSMHIPEVQKNYLLEIANLLKKVDAFAKMKERRDYVSNCIQNAIKTYETIYENGIFLETESKDYHLEAWLTFLQDK